MLRGSDVTYTMTCVLRRDYHLGHILEPLSKFCTHPRPGAMLQYMYIQWPRWPLDLSISSNFLRFQGLQRKLKLEIRYGGLRRWEKKVTWGLSLGVFLSGRVGTVGRIDRGPQEASGHRWDGPVVAFTEGCLEDHKLGQEMSGRGARRRNASSQRGCPLGTHWLLSLALPGLS